MWRMDRRRARGSGGGLGAGSGAGGAGGGSGAGSGAVRVGIARDPEAGSPVTFRRLYTKFGLKRVTGGGIVSEKDGKKENETESCESPCRGKEILILKKHDIARHSNSVGIRIIT